MTATAFVFAALGVACLVLSPKRARAIVYPIGVSLLGLAVWQAVCELNPKTVFPTPGASLAAMAELVESKRLWGDVAASLFRVTWGFFLAAAIGIPLGLVVGWSTRAFKALNPIVQGLRPISPTDLLATPE